MVQTTSLLWKRVTRRRLKRKKRKKDRHCPRPARKIFHWLQGKKKLQRRPQSENLQNYPTLKKNLMKSHLMKVRKKPRQKVNQRESRRRKILNQKKSLKKNLKTSPHLPRRCQWASPRMQLSLTYLTRVKRRRKKKRTTRTRRLEFNPKLLLPYNHHPGSTHHQKHPPSQKLHLRMRTRRTPMTDSSPRLQSRPRMRIKKKTPTVTE